MNANPFYRADQTNWADAHWRALLEALPDALLVVNGAGEIVSANQRAEKLFGYDPEGLRGKALELLIPPGLREIHAQHMARFLSAPQTRPMGAALELFAVCADGSEFPVDISLSPVTIEGQTLVVSSIRDMTAQRKAEENRRQEAVLHESETVFQLVTNHAPVLIWVSGVHKGCIYFNKAWLDFTGKPMELELNDGWTRGVHPEDVQYVMDTYVQAFDRREEFRMEYRLKRHDGEYRWILDMGVPRFAADGSFAGYIGSAIDVTDSKLAEKQLALANERLSLAMESGKSVGWDWDVQAGTDTWFGDLKSMFGIDSKACSGRVEDFHRQVHPEDREEVAQEVAAAMREHKPYTAEFRILWPDGTNRWVAAEGKFQYSADGKPERMSGMAVDITDRKQAEEALRASEHRFHQFFATLPEYCWMISPGGEILDVNPAACHGLGYRREELVGRPLSAIYAPECHREMQHLFEQWQEQGELHNEELVVLTKSGERRTALLNVGSVRDGQGKLLHSTSVMVDITERKRMEEALSGMSRKLIEAQERERTRIARDLHDDINQRLALLALELEQLRKGPSEAEGGFRDRLGELGKQVSAIVSDVHAISHELHSSKLELLGLVAAAKSFCAEFAKQNKVEIDFAHENIPKHLPGEVSTCLFRVLQEALRNAVRHSKAHSFHVQLRGAADEVHLMVSDSGVGFEPASETTGDGLGLISMRERVGLVGGSISVLSKPQRGTVIKCHVPLNYRSGSPGAAAGLSQ